MAQSTVASLESYLKKESKSGKTSIEWDWAQDRYGHGVGLYANLKAFNDKARKNLRAMLEQWCYTMTMYMKQNHRWHNRTGKAEAGIAAHLIGIGGNQYTSSSKFVIELKHGDRVWYGWRLEYLYQKRYAIIQPTLDEYGNKIIDSISLNGLYFGNKYGL